MFENRANSTATTNVISTTDMLRKYVEQEALKYGSIASVKIEEAVDIRFAAKGDLYDGETAAIEIMRRLRETFPGVAFDFLVFPEESP